MATWTFTPNREALQAESRVRSIRDRASWQVKGYLGGQGNLILRFIIGIIGVVMWLLGV